MRLGDLTDIASVRTGDEAVAFTRPILDSRKATRGTLFAALPGEIANGADYIDAAIAKGAAAILCTPDAAARVPRSIGLVAAPDPRAALAAICARIYDRPGTVVAVTGTNGKTSVAQFTRQLWSAIGRPAAAVGTLGITWADGTVTPSLTTPDPVSLHEALARFRDEGIEAVALEASSHGLDQRRLDGARPDAVAFTNIAQDHLDYHHTVARYRAAKMRLFDIAAPNAPLIVDADGEGAAAVIAELEAAGRRVTTVGRAGRDLRLVEARRTATGFALDIETANARYAVDLALHGAFQISNVLVAAALVIGTGGEERAVLEASASLEGVAGRLETVGATHEGAPVIVDYAHTEASLRAAVQALKPEAGRLVVVFGAGGDRDADKRPKMGRAAARADVAIVTDDNPRSEDPAAIRAAVLKGCPDGIEIGDRRKAIRHAIGMLHAGDVLLIAGKGHETGQTIAGETHPFSDRAEARAALAGDV